jgi:LysM repeat protein
VSGVANTATIPGNQIGNEEETAVNDVVATGIAASVANATELAIEPYINERAISTRVQSEYLNITDTSSITKPVIVQLSTASRNITSYAVVEGDSVAGIAARFGLSERTIRWANNLKDNDTVAVGSRLDILPIDGIAYVVKGGDTIEKIADRYKASVATIISHNDLELAGISTGLKIIIPGGVLPTEERPGYTAPTYYSSGFLTGVGAWSGTVLSMRTFYGVDNNSGGYVRGNCTAYAFYRRAEIGRPISGQLGNAYTWATAARALNYTVNGTPAVGAVIQSGNHVGVVEEILPNGDLRITDMNYGYRVYNLAERIIPAATVNNYMFIH